MTTDQKIVVFAISSILLIVLSVVTYNFHSLAVREAAYYECLKVDKLRGVESFYTRCDLR